MRYARKTALLLILTLIVGLLSMACGAEKSISTDPEPRYHYGSTLDYIDNEEVEMVKLSEMEYIRPSEEEVNAVTGDLYHLSIKVGSYESAEDFLKDYYPLLTRQRKIEAMYYLAYFRHDLDQTDPYYLEEFEYCSGVLNEISGYNSSLMSSLAFSPLREDLEDALFGKNYFRNTVDAKNASFSDMAMELYNRMDALRYKFYTLTYEQKATVNGETKFLNEWLSSDSEEDRLNGTCAYIEQYHDEIAAIYVDLVKASREFAKEMGYDSFPAYKYDIEYQGDYTTNRTKDFFNYVKTYLVPIAKELTTNDPDLLKNIVYENYPYPKDIDPKEFLNSACQKMGGLIWEVCRFTTAYELYDTSFAQSKRLNGYSTYIPYYEAPIIFVNPSKYDVICTISHEFGHGVDHYYNYDCNKNASTVGEMYSQAMEYLTLKYTDALTDDVKKESLSFKLAQFLLHNILEACADACFEEAAYSLKPSDVTPEKLDELYLKIWNEFGLDYIYPEDIQAKSWVYRSHTFIMPCYTINYATSVIGGLEICMLEEEEAGKGIATYEEMIKTTTGLTFTEVFEETVLDNPLDEETIIKVAEFFKKMLELE